jgi:hypothetical protein
MKRTLLAVLVVAAIAAIAVPAFAQEGTKLGLGYFRTQAPIGGRAWINDKLAIDVGVGFANQDEMGATALEKKTAICVDAGVPIVLVGDETTRFFIRPGFTFFSNPAYSGGEAKWINSKTIWVAGTLGVEHWFGKRFSLAAGHGVIFESYDPGTKGSKTSSSIKSEALSIATLGFHFYFN